MELDELKKNIDLEDYLVSQGYYKSEKSTRRTPIYTNGNEKLIVRQGNDCKTYFVAGTEEQGTIIHFLKYRPELLQNYPASNIYESIKLCLNKYSGETFPTSHYKLESTAYHFDSQSFFIPRIKDINNRVFSYLKTRGISSETLNSPVFENVGLIPIENTEKHTKYYNLAFPLFREDKITGIDYRFMDNKGKNYKMLMPGSDKSHSIGISSNKREKINELILNESPIDAMSHYELFRKGKDNIQYIYFDGTLTKGQIHSFLNHYELLKHPKITIGFDNDADGKLTGQAYTTSILCSILCDTPIPFSYSGKDHFAFIFPNDCPKEKVKQLFQGIEGIIFEDGDPFKYSFPKEKSIINNINKVLSHHLNIAVETPLTKDWNDDLKIKQQTSNVSRNINKNICI